jgi:hypothetical protein
MNIRVFIVIVFIFSFACKTDEDKNTDSEKMKMPDEMVFDQEKWETKDGADYPFRDKMVNNLIYNDSVRTLDKEEIIDLLGDPNRINENFIYYTIAQKRLGLWPLHTRTLVIKFSPDNTIDWMKIHE